LENKKTLTSTHITPTSKTQDKVGLFKEKPKKIGISVKKS